MEETMARLKRSLNKDEPTIKLAIYYGYKRLASVWNYGNCCRRCTVWYDLGLLCSRLREICVSIQFGLADFDFIEHQIEEVVDLLDKSYDWE